MSNVISFHCVHESSYDGMITGKIKLIEDSNRKVTGIFSGKENHLAIIFECQKDIQKECDCGEIELMRIRGKTMSLMI